jgi:hypothetical protein
MKAARSSAALCVEQLHQRSSRSMSCVRFQAFARCAKAVSSSSRTADLPAASASRAMSFKRS